MASNRISYKERIEELESICLAGKTFPSTETDEDMFVTSDFLLDTLMCLYYECNMPAFRSLKNSQKFQESGEIFPNFILSNDLSNNNIFCSKTNC